jgi:hypothetical protein
MRFRRTASSTLKWLGLGIALAVVSPATRANLILFGNIDNVAGGVGNSQTILSLQSPGNATVETGGVGIVSGAETRVGDALAGVNTPLPLRTISSAGIQNASDIVIYLDAQEPGNDNLITIDRLTLNIFGPGGNNSLLFTASLTPVPLPNLVTCPGQGNNCINAFVLDSTQAAQAQQSFNGANRIGVEASLSAATGGPDRFFLSGRDDVGIPPQKIPEPAPLALFGLALVALVGRGRASLDASCNSSRCPRTCRIAG